MWRSVTTNGLPSLFTLCVVVLNVCPCLIPCFMVLCCVIYLVYNPDFELPTVGQCLMYVLYYVLMRWSVTTNGLSSLFTLCVVVLNVCPCLIPCFMAFYCAIFLVYNPDIELASVGKCLMYVFGLSPPWLN